MAGRKAANAGNASGGNGNDTGGNSEFIDPASALGNGSGGTGGSGDGGTIRDAFGTEFDAAVHSGPDKRNSDGSFRRKRGRKSGGKSQKVPPNLEQSVEVLSRGLCIMHASLAAITQTPELVLDKTEAEGLTEATLNLLALYDLKPDPKIEAALILAGQVGIVYGTRFVAIRARKAQQRKEKEPGVAGVYTADGMAAGTTTFHEYPVEDNLGNSRVN